jgi:hypothetical protein
MCKQVGDYYSACGDFIHTGERACSNPDSAACERKFGYPIKTTKYGICPECKEDEKLEKVKEESESKSSGKK